MLLSGLPGAADVTNRMAPDVAYSGFWTMRADQTGNIQVVPVAAGLAFEHQRMSAVLQFTQRDPVRRDFEVVINVLHRAAAGLAFTLHS
jgi:hypothetical protein